MRGLRTIINHIRQVASNPASIFGVFIFSALAVSGVGALVPANSAYAAGSNDIVQGGIWNRDLASKCGGDVKTIMDHYWIDCNLSGVVEGRVCRDGNVYVGDRVVARNSSSIGRDPIQGSHPISIGGKTYYETHNSQALLSQCLDAFVKLDGNSFKYAIIKACGNPVYTPEPVIETPPPSTPKEITVCELATKKFIKIKEEDFNSSKHSKKSSDCQEKTIQVCVIATKEIKTIKEAEFDSTKHSKNTADCAEKKIEVCELSSNSVIKINEKDFDSKKHSKNIEDCKTMTVCDLSSKKMITIKTSEFDANKHSKEATDCETKPCENNPKGGGTECPAELPQTGIGDNLMMGGFGLGSLIIAGSAYLSSRKDLLSALINR